MPRKRGVRSGHRREFRVVRLQRSKVDLSLNELDLLAQQILKESMAELEQLQALTLQVQQLTSAMVDTDKRHTQEIQQRESTAGGDERNLDGAQHEGIDVSSRPVRVAGPKDPPQGATLRRTTDVVENLRVQWRAHLNAQDRKYRELLEKIDDPTKDVRNGDLDLENQELNMQLYFAPVLVMPRESVGQLIVRNVKQGEGAVAWRQILGEYASTEPGNVLAMWSKLGDFRFPQGRTTKKKRPQRGYLPRRAEIVNFFLKEESREIVTKLRQKNQMLSPRQKEKEKRRRKEEKKKKK